MAREITPDFLRQSEFRSSFRGLDPAEVRATLEAAALKLEQLDAERRNLKSKLDQAPPSREMEKEFDDIGREVSEILQSAREAAEAMRERASLDATRWRSEAMEGADTTRRDAAADAEAMRRDAWVTGSELLEQAAANAEAMRAHAERDVLTIMGEAEREAHRLTSGARREAEDVVRNATMDAEKITSDATKRRDEIIDAANRQAAAAQERTRALEQRRDELLEELENVRSTLTRLEGSLEERREALDLTGSPDSSSVRVVHPPADAKKQWELGETVRVVPPEHVEKEAPDERLASELSEEVARSQSPEPPGQAQPPAQREPPAEPDPRTRPEPRAEPEPEPAPEPETPAEPEAIRESGDQEEEPAKPGAKERDDLSALFAALREGGDEELEGPVAQVESDASNEDDEQDRGTDWIEVREQRLLPITNRALRGVKKAMTEIQNVALDSLRTDEEWSPDEGSIAEAVHAEVVAVWSESFAAGHAVAEQMADSKLKRPPTPSSKADRDFAADLAAAVSGALEKAGEGPRERQSAASRIFRVWRSDEAERRIRDIALGAFELGIEESRKVATG
ncbi:MAG TPA: DivIVA domain-containing protein [Acidimicrobiia bacterium]